MAIELKKGQKIDLTKNNPQLNEILLETEYYFSNGNNTSVDLSAFLVKENGKVRNDNDFIFYNNKIGENTSVEYEVKNNKETMKINFQRVSYEINKIIITMTIDNSNFGMLKEGNIKIIDAKSNYEIIKYTFEKDFTNETAIVVMEFYRHNGNWKINCVGNGFFGGLKSLAENFGLEVGRKPQQNKTTSSSGTISSGKVVTGGKKNMRSHEIDYEIYGSDLQAVEVELDPGEKVIAEAGAMSWMDDGISYEAKMGDGSKPQNGFFGTLVSAGKRALTGESLFVTHFTNTGHGKKRVAFAAPYPGRIVPLDLSQYGEEIICQKDSFLCAAYGTEIGITLSRRIGAGFFGGEGFVLQNLKGDGMAFIHAGGTIIEKKLNGEKLKVDTGCIVGFTKGIDYDVERAGNLKSMFFGGEGLFLATLEGHGTVWLQTLPFSRLVDRIIKSGLKTDPKNRSRGEGSVLGDVGRFFDGDNNY